MKISDLKPLELSDKPEFDGLLAKYPPTISEHTFTNFFVWRHYHRFSWTRLGEWIVVLSERQNQPPCFWGPIGGGDGIRDVVDACLDFLKSRGVAEPTIKRVPKSIVDNLQNADLVISDDRDQFDYVYRVKEVVDLAGRDFHQKKNHLNKFRKTYSWTYEPLVAANAEECLDMQTEWCDLRQCAGDESLAGEDKAVWESLKNFDALGIFGGVLRVNGKIEAFTFAERLNADTAVEHVEKANPKLDGIYVAIANAFAEKGLADYTFVNREQDLGTPGLRKAKLAWNPTHFVEKFVVVKKS